jgi:hypothetical protein
MLDGLKRISTALGLLAATAAASQAQAPAPSYNQSTAEAVAAALRSSPNLVQFRIEIETRDGMTTLLGDVSTMAQKVEALSRAQAVPGVNAVVDRINVGNDPRVQQAQYQPGAAPNQLAGGPGGDIIYDGGAPAGPGFHGGGAPGAMGPGGAPGAMGFGGAPGAMGPGVVMDGPAPVGPAGAPGGTSLAMPNNPNYAWPSYAPYPNFSAVGYPTAYPWQAWPNIAPPYPYPEVPLDWRAVTLRWDDGIWWLDFKKHYTRPFFTPYPFGIFAY